MTASATLFAHLEGMGFMKDYQDALKSRVLFVTASELLESRSDLPRADEYGYAREIGRGIRGASASLGIGKLPVGQRSPRHSADGEHLLLGLEGSITWLVDGSEYVMDTLDLLYIGPDVTYEYWNSGEVKAAFIDVVAKGRSWPARGTYERE
jgi:quercetin dioxygenase-like cupin family protein